MEEIYGDIWEYHAKGHPITITTNGYVNSRGQCVMGRGIAKQAKIKFPELPYDIANHLRKLGNTVGYYPNYNLFSFPTKHVWYRPSDPALIVRSTKQLVNLADIMDLSRVYMVRPGCSNGRLEWKDVKPLIEPWLDSRFVIVEWEGVASVEP